MSNTGTVHARIDAQLKANAESVLSDLGISPTDAINIYYRQIVFNQGIPFKLARPRYNAETEAALLQARQMLADPNLKTFSNVDDMFAELDK
ncbi:MAG: type II toxin-antitoxin system RelB/DinJ family antitoxin [Firmicutes bacterium]|nr:type II toxin-antitoxin system RelB/DinJ family antitoxin [Bacillota bacterium]